MRKRSILLGLLLLTCRIAANAQDHPVTGVVRDQDGEALPGVTVQVKGRNTGTSTDAEGAYSISAPPEGVLVFSFLGFLSQEIPVNNRSTIDVTLAEGTEALDEIVVVGYGTQRKKDLTGSVVTISSRELENQPAVNPLQAAQGRAAGVQISSPSGKPGKGLAVSIRGNTSLTASNNPLYVVDGMTTRDISFLNPNDIESFSVLKDASAAAIYGSSGANGVVLITTKSGAEGRSFLKLSGYAGVSDVWKKIDVLNQAQYLELMQELGYEDPNRANSDWQDMAFGTGEDYNAQLSASGGSESTRYYFSGAFQQQKGTVAPAAFERYTLKSNISSQVKEWFKLSTNLAFSHNKSTDVADNNNVAQGGTILSALTTPPTIGVWNDDGTYTSNPNKGGWENPIANAFGPQNNSSNNRFLGGVTGEIAFTENLSFRSSLNIDYTASRNDYFLDPYRTDWGRQPTNQGIGHAENWQATVWLNENVLSYQKDFGKNALTALAGATMQTSKWERTYAEGKQFPGDQIPTLNAAGLRSAISSNIAEWKKLSYLSRITYAYDSKYLLTANFRADGSSRFAPDNRFGFFPSVSAGWRISAEPFFGDAPAVDDLKIRAGWGKTGNDEGIGDYAHYSLLDPTGQGGIRQNQPGNEFLGWEETTQTNVGIDLSMFNGRLIVNADAYLKKTRDLLVAVQLPPTSGFGSRAYNVGAMENKGFEISLSSQNLVREDFRWSTDLNFSLNRNKVTSLGTTTQSLDFGQIYEREAAIKVEPGRPLGSFYGYVSEGVDTETGMIRYKDLNGDGVIDAANDRTYIGNAQPSFTFGLNNTLGYRNFSLTFLFQGIVGNDVFNASRIELETMNDSKNQSTDVLRRWTEDNRNTDIPAPEPEAGGTANTRGSSRFVEDGTYVRLKTLTLSYSLDKALIDKLGIGNISIYGTGYNLLTFTGYKGFDPEVSTDYNNQVSSNTPNMGIDYGTYPQARTLILGLNVEF